MNKKHYFECYCNSPEHSFIFYDDADLIDQDYEGLTLQIHLSNYLNWYQRLWAAIKYIFGHKSQYGDWDNVTLSLEDTKRLRDVCDRALQIRNRKL